MSSQTSMKFAFRRLFDRYSHFRALRVIYEGHSESIPLHAPDLSPRGMFINTARELPEGTVVRIQFRLSQSNFLVQARGEVRYCLPGVGVGVEFVHISAQAEDAIEDAITRGSAEEQI